ncbi:MAG: ATP-binding cassette domain-containing protein, partial [Actinomycetota bacterium]|nr:ATP-binding cassette domain-containing protein [Actinomycetota bacterium]
HFPKLAGLRGSQAGNLSGGERQMLAVGRGLMANPKVLLLDDPLRAWHRSCCRRSGRCWPRSKTPA